MVARFCLLCIRYLLLRQRSERTRWRSRGSGGGSGSCLCGASGRSRSARGATAETVAVCIKAANSIGGIECEVRAPLGRHARLLALAVRRRDYGVRDGPVAPADLKAVIAHGRWLGGADCGPASASRAGAQTCASGMNAANPIGRVEGEIGAPLGARAGRLTCAVRCSDGRGYDGSAAPPALKAILAFWNHSL